MKKYAAGFLVIIMMLSFCGCKSETTQTESEPAYVYAFDGTEFDTASDFDCGYAVVSREDKTYFMDTDGKEGFIFPSDAISVEYLGQGLAFVEKQDPTGTPLYFIYDTKGNSVAAPGLYSNEMNAMVGFPYCIKGKIIYATEDNQMKLCDPYGNIVFKHTIIMPNYHPKFGYIGDNGEMVLPDCLNFENRDEAIYEVIDMKTDEPPQSTFLLDGSGNSIKKEDGSDFRRVSAESGTKENMALFNNDVSTHNDGYWNDKGESIDEATYELGLFLSEGTSIFLSSEDEAFGYKDQSGEIIIEPIFKSASPVRNGYGRIWDGTTYQYIIIGNPKIDKTEIQAGIIILDPSKTDNDQMPVASHLSNDSKPDSSIKFSAVDFIGKTYSEIESIIGKKLEFFSGIEGGTSYSYENQDSELFTFGFPYSNDPQYDVDQNSEVVYIGVSGGAYIDYEIRTDMSIQEIEEIKGITLEIYHQEGEFEGDYAALTLDNGYEVTLQTDENLEKIIWAEICCKK